MLSKCEWKDGKFEGCMNYCAVFGAYIEYTSGRRHNFCSFCGADIRKPEPEKPLIVKSGETWVKYENDENYLCVNPYNYNNGFKDPDNWKLFSEIEKEELTDEIAKLRPVVIHRINPFQLDMLYGVHNNLAIIYYENPYETVDSDYSIDGFHLATPHKLLEIE